MTGISLDFTKIKLVRINAETPGISSFKNEKQAMVDHIRTRALEDQNSKVGITWAWIYDKGTIIGYISIAMSSMEKNGLSSDQSKPFKDVRYQSIPALLIGQLATHKEYVGKGIGRHMVLWAIDQARKYSNRIGCRLVVLHPRKDVVEWYVKKLKFNHFKMKMSGRESDMMYFDLND